MVESIDEIYETVSTYKSKDALVKIKEVAESLKENSRILVLGAGQGAEAIVFKKFCPSSSVTVVDRWSGEGWRDNGKLNHWSENSQSNFLCCCEKLNVEIYETHCFDVFKSDRINDLKGPWDLIYYDCNDNTDGNEFNMITAMLENLWKKINVGGILMGDDYVFNRPDFKMTPVVDEFIMNIGERFQFDSDKRNTSFYWMVKKNG